MKKFLVVMSEMPGHGRGVNGQTRGLYSRRRPELWERFVAQLPR